MSDFIATHVIQTGTTRIYVHAEPWPGGHLSLYSEEEWEAKRPADWMYDPDRGLTFQGSISAPICNGASFETFEDCRWTRVDGWNDDGTKEADYRGPV